MKCEDNLINKQELEKRALKNGDQVKIVCQESCGMNPAVIYGDLIYSDDSSACKAASHAGALDIKGGEVKIMIVNAEQLYKSGLRNGIKSESKASNGVVGMAF